MMVGGRVMEARPPLSVPLKVTPEEPKARSLAVVTSTLQERAG